MERNADVVVVGGGVIGLSVAWTLQRQGRDVVLLEKEELGAGCSTGNAGLVVPSHVVPLAAPGVVAQGLRWLFRRESPFRIKPRVDIDLLRWLWTFYWSCTEEHVRRSIPVLRELNLTSRSIYEEWADEGFEFGYRPSGLLMLHETKKGRTKDLDQADRARGAGLEVDVLGRTELGAVSAGLPPRVKGGVYYSQDALLDPARLVDGLGRQLERGDTALCRGGCVTGFDCEDGTIRAVQTTEGVICPEEVVLAAGAWSSPLGRKLGLDVPVEAAKGYSVTVDVPEGAPDVPFILTEKKVSVTPLGDNRVRFAGTLELAGFDDSVDERRLRPILETAAGYVPEIDPEAPEDLDVWVGFRPCTPDGLPLIGPVPEYDNLVLATGHSMMGVSLAPITGLLVAKVIERGPSSVDLSGVLPTRFR